MRTIKKIYESKYVPMSDLITYSPLPNENIEQIDPFLFLNHHGYQNYPPGNSGLPFGPHPHRGMETVTFIVEGDILHKDNNGHESLIEAGGVQWMTAGRGLIHSEISSKEFKEKGGALEILQLWLNLPSKLKMIEPCYFGLQKNEIPEISKDEGKVKLNLVSGEWNENRGAFESITDINLATVNFKAGGNLKISIPLNCNIFFYVIRGTLIVNEKEVKFRQLAEFSNDDEILNIYGETESLLLIGYGKPFNETVVAKGPFVMNTEEEIMQAYIDYQQGKFGRW